MLELVGEVVLDGVDDIVCVAEPITTKVDIDPNCTA